MNSVIFAIFTSQPVIPLPGESVHFFNPQKIIVFLSTQRRVKDIKDDVVTVVVFDGLAHLCLIKPFGLSP
jgi:hypothetical protein